MQKSMMAVASNLTIARTIVEAQGGQMTASNNAAGGATFTVTLPRADTAARADGYSTTWV